MSLRRTNQGHSIHHARIVEYLSLPLRPRSRLCARRTPPPGCPRAPQPSARSPTVRAPPSSRRRTGTSIIYLFRRNLLRREISNAANNQLGDAQAHPKTEAELASARGNVTLFEGVKLVSVIVKRLEARATVVGYYVGIPSLFLAYEDLVAGSSDAEARWAEVFEFLHASANATMKTTKKPLLAIHQTRPILSEVDNAAAVRDTMRSVCSPEVSFGGGCEEVLAGAAAARDNAIPDKAMRPLLKRYAAANAALAAAAANATSSTGSWPSPTRRSRRSIVR